MILLSNLLEHFIAHPIQFIILLVAIAFIKSTIFLSSILPPASIILTTCTVTGLSIIPVWLIWLAVTIGSTVGSIFNFHLGQIILHTNILNYLMTKYELYFLHIQNKLRTNSILVIFISRFVAVLRYLVPLVAGMLHLCPITVYCISVVSAAIWSALYIYGSHIFSLFFN